MRSRNVALLMLVLGMLCVLILAHARNAPEASEKGKEVYENSCAHCHGVEGRGDGSAAENLHPETAGFHTRFV